MSEDDNGSQTSRTPSAQARVSASMRDVIDLLGDPLVAELVLQIVSSVELKTLAAAGRDDRLVRATERLERANANIAKLGQDLLVFAKELQQALDADRKTLHGASVHCAGYSLPIDRVLTLIAFPSVKGWTDDFLRKAVRRNK